MNIDAEVSSLLSPFGTGWLTGAALREDPPPPPPGRALEIHESAERILHAERTVILFGKPGTGKTTLATAACMEIAFAGMLACFIDFEEGPRAFRRRLRRIRVGPSEQGYDTDEGISDLIGYWPPGQPLDFATMPADGAVGLVVLNGVAKAIVADGGDEKDAGDFLRFMARWVEPMRQLYPEAVILLVDHPGHSETWRPRGTSAKEGDVDVALELRGLGKYRSLVVSKDRWDDLDTPKGSAVAKLCLLSNVDGTVTVALHEVGGDTDAEGRFRPTGYMEKSSEYLEQVGEAVTDTVLKNVRGKDEYIRTALDCLVREGFISSRTGSRGAVWYRHLRRFEVGLISGRAGGTSARDEGADLGQEETRADLR